VAPRERGIMQLCRTLYLSWIGCTMFLSVEAFRRIIEDIGLVVDGLGVIVIVVALIAAFVRAVKSGQFSDECYKRFRQDIGKGILLGLELLVAGDIIRTVAVAPTLDNVVVLGVIVVIRTFLSWSLDVELEGRLPWKKSENPSAP
jgi:uncharacterized membrane protein